uniref:Uncharacterized protein n=1 Tax=Arundo donax TaxID=35708 RepID=A0A0A9EJC5_ARUDO
MGGSELSSPGVDLRIMRRGGWREGIWG